MRVLSVELHNFGSFEHIKFDMSDKGLTLISGPTGAGKSTLCDAIPWVLFGTTAKGGAVDEVRSWFTDEPTKGVLSFLDWQIVRIRGKQVNDLYIETQNGIIRGKDLKDTQNIINTQLGFDETLYLAGAYFHEFSQVAQFFTTNAKNRRQICDQLLDLTLANSLQAKNSLEIKRLTKENAEHTAAVKSYEDTLKYKGDLWLAEKAKAENFEANKASRLEAAKAKHRVFEISRQERIAKEETALNSINESIQPKEKFETTEKRLKAKLAALPDNKCPTCGAKHSSQERADISASIHEAEKRRIKNDELLRRANTAAFSIKSIAKEVNPYEATLLEIADLENTHTATAEKLLADNTATSVRHSHRIHEMLKGQTQLADAEVLAEVLLSFRSTLIQNTIVRLQDATNSLISEHFDGELQVALAVESSDKLDVEITKDGNACAYTQLSKGQRCILKLCFSIAVMKTIAQHHALSFNAIFLDEALDGLSDSMKEKAYGLFAKLSLDYSSIFVVDHSEALKSMFTNKIEVALVNGRSEIV